MAILLYNIFLLAYQAGIRISAGWNRKAAKWVKGRKGLFEKIKQGQVAAGSPGLQAVWFHCASLGEFEQGRPLMERLKAAGNCRIILTFFSPSGYENLAQQHGPYADEIYYLPIDSGSHARRFIDLVNPSLVIFVKYDLWYYYLREVKRRKIPLLLISAIFREKQSFTRWYGYLQRKMLSFFTHIFVQNEKSMSLLAGIGFSGNVSVAGDTRFDRVIEIASNWHPVAGMEVFHKGGILIVAGSTWPADEEMLATAFSKPGGFRMVIAPHEIDDAHLEKIGELFSNTIRYSALQPGSTADGSGQAVMIMNNIGRLSRLYGHADICYIGGGFTRDGVHNMLEAAVYGKPLIIGPNYGKYSEAIDLVNAGAAVSYNTEQELMKIISELIADASLRAKKGKAARDYVLSKGGSSARIAQFIQENRLLTS